MNMWQVYIDRHTHLRKYMFLVVPLKLLPVQKCCEIYLMCHSFVVYVNVKCMFNFFTVLLFNLIYLSVHLLTTKNNWL